MALTPEDGTGIEGADAYVSATDADAYHADHGNADWSALDQAAKEAAIRYATAYLDGEYRWRGSVLTDTQALGWPRDGAKDDEGRDLTGVPRRVVSATCEIALQHAQSALNAPEGPRVTQEQIGPLSVSYADSSGNQGEDYPMVTRLLRGLIVGGTNAVQVTRA